MDEYKLKDYTERLKKETNENAHKMLYMWIKQDVISLNEYQQLVLNLSLQLVSKRTWRIHFKVSGIAIHEDIEAPNELAAKAVFYHNKRSNKIDNIEEINVC